jgi:hypothetical protein
VPEATQAEQPAPEATPAAATTTRKKTPPPPPAPSGVNVKIAGVPGTGGSWMLVRGRNSSGPVLFEGTLGGGESRTWKVGRSVWLRAGNTTQIAVTVNGKPAQMSELTGNYLISKSGARLVSTG